MVVAFDMAMAVGMAVEVVVVVPFGMEVVEKIWQQLHPRVLAMESVVVEEMKHQFSLSLSLKRNPLPLA